jgi:hypothetical protein
VRAGLSHDQRKLVAALPRSVERNSKGTRRRDIHRVSAADLEEAGDERAPTHDGSAIRRHEDPQERRPRDPEIHKERGRLWAPGDQADRALRIAGPQIEVEKLQAELVAGGVLQATPGSYRFRKSVV